MGAKSSHSSSSITNLSITPETNISNGIIQISIKEKKDSIGAKIGKTFTKDNKDKTHSSYTSNGVKVYYANISKEDEYACIMPNCNSTNVYYSNRRNIKCQSCEQDSPSKLPQDDNYCETKGCVFNFRTIRHIIKCNDCILKFCSSCLNHHNYNYSSHCKCDDCKPKYLMQPMTGAMIYQSKCDFCKLVIPLDNKTAITWLSDRSFSYDTYQPDMSTIPRNKFSIFGHEGNDNNNKKALCLECQNKLGTFGSFIGSLSLSTEYKIFGFVKNIRITTFTYYNHYDKETYQHPDITLNMTDKDLIECLNIYLMNESFDSLGIMQLLSLSRLDDIKNNTVKSEILKILSSNEEKDLPKKKRLTTLFDTIWNEYLDHLVITGLNAPLIRMIYHYSPTSEYSEFFPEVAK